MKKAFIYNRRFLKQFKDVTFPATCAMLCIVGLAAISQKEVSFSIDLPQWAGKILVWGALIMIVSFIVDISAAFWKPQQKETLQEKINRKYNH